VQRTDKVAASEPVTCDRFGCIRCEPHLTEGQHVSGIVASPEGITNPPIDDLLEIADSKYALVIYSAKRARQINAYYSQLGEGLLEYVGPLVETHPHEKPLSVALREINAKLLTAEPVEA
jgi:DNA-directed RNA polymerase subunit omega